jgi:hypothetical protein
MKTRRGRREWFQSRFRYGADTQSALLPQGGHAFRKARRGTRHTLVLTHSYTPEQTGRALSKCKLNGVSIANAMFTLSTFAYLRSTKPDQSGPELPIMLYSALNVRPFLEKSKIQPDWYHIAIGYYKCVLTSFPAVLECEN